MTIYFHRPLHFRHRPRGYRARDVRRDVQLERTQALRGGLVDAHRARDCGPESTAILRCFCADRAGQARSWPRAHPSCRRGGADSGRLCPFDKRRLRHWESPKAWCWWCRAGTETGRCGEGYAERASAKEQQAAADYSLFYKKLALWELCAISFIRAA